MATFSKRLAELRHERNYTQPELAEKLHMSKGAIGNYESGSRVPKLEDLENIADFFNVEIDYLIGRTNERPEYSLEEMWIIECYRRCDVVSIRTAIKNLLRPYDQAEEQEPQKEKTDTTYVS